MPHPAGNFGRLCGELKEEADTSLQRVFTQEHLYLQFEVYDAAKGKPSSAAAKPPTGLASDAPAKTKSRSETIRVLTSVQFMRGDAKVYESRPLIATEVNVRQRKAVEFQLDLPLQTLKPGFYTCQGNIIDDVAGNYAFPRWAMLIKEPATVAPVPTQPGAGASR